MLKMERLLSNKIFMVIILQFAINAITFVTFYVLLSKLKKQWIEQVQKQNKFNEIYNENIQICEDNFRVINTNIKRRKID
jgi:hypothetical protein